MTNDELAAAIQAAHDSVKSCSDREPAQKVWSDHLTMLLAIQRSRAIGSEANPSPEPK